MLTSPLKSTMRDLQDGTKPLQEGLNDTTREVESTRRSVNRGSVARRARVDDTAPRNGTDASGTEPAGRGQPRPRRVRRRPQA